MARFKFEGVDDLVARYEKLNQKSLEVVGKAIYNGAGVVMDIVEEAVEAINIDDNFATSENPKSGPSTIQKIGLIRSLGISKMREDGSFLNVKIGFDGYNNLKTKKWPQGQPNSMVARSIESGTSFMIKQPFMRPAEQSAKGPCEAIMARTVDKEIEKIME